MTTPATPGTAAGKVLLTSLENINTRAYNPTLAGDILAIEAEAADALLAALRALLFEHDVVLPNCPTAQQARALLRDLSPVEDGQ